MNWIALAAATLIVCVWMVWPLLAKRPDPRHGGTPGDHATPVSSDGGTSRSPGRAKQPLLDGPRCLAAAVIALVPVFAALLYLEIGNPGMVDQPLAERSLKTEASSPDPKTRMGTLLERLRAQPNDPETWLQAGRELLRAGEVELAARVLEQTRILAPDRADVLEWHGEALVSLANGEVTEGARDAFEKVLLLDPRNPRSRHFLALADYQAGRREEALRQWSDLARDAPPKAVWLEAIKTQIRTVAGELEVDAANWLPAPEPDPDRVAPRSPDRSGVGGGKTD